MPDLLHQPAAHLLHLLHTKRISATELATEHIHQIDRLNPQLNALVDFDPERVLASARALDAQTEPRGLLHGLALTIKSSISIAGHGCEIGRPYADEHVLAVAVALDRAFGYIPPPMT